MPSYTFVSTANAFVLRGAVPVFVDIRPDTLNIDETKIEAAITPTHQGHRAGALRRRRLRDGRHHGHRPAPRPAGDRGRGPGHHVDATRAGRSARSATWAACRSTRPRTSSPARAARCWSTTRRSSSGPRSSARRAPTAASSSAARWTSTPGSTSARPTCRARSSRRSCGRRWRRRTRSRSGGWRCGAPTTSGLRDAGEAGQLRRPIVPEECAHNAHMYYVLLPDLGAADGADRGAARGTDIRAVFHYVPLHSAPAGLEYGRATATCR